MHIVLKNPSVQQYKSHYLSLQIQDNKIKTKTSVVVNLDMFCKASDFYKLCMKTTQKTNLLYIVFVLFFGVHYIMEEQ